MYLKLTLLLALSILPLQLNGAKILLLIPMAGPSQYHLFMTLMNSLGDRGHTVTVITATPGKSTHPNVTVHGQDVPSTAIMKEWLAKNLGSPPNSIFNLLEFTEHIPAMVEQFLKRDDVKKLISEGRQFDLAIVDHICNEFANAFATSLATTVVVASSGAPMPWSNPTPAPPSYVPTYLEPMPSVMDFKQRFLNTLIYVTNRLTFYYMTLPLEQKLLSKYVPQSPTIAESEKKIHFFITNQDPVMSSPRPTLPNVINAGCWHCRDPKPLPKDLEDFIESSGENGFIVFGLGTNVKSEYLHPKTIQGFLNAFARLKQNVVWKLGAKINNLPKNVRTIDWMPQQDMLGHPKVRLFMSHGGLLSMQEAIYHGVPVIGFPIFFDQHGNIERVKELGMGERSFLNNVTEERVYQTITQIVNDKRYSEVAKNYSRIMRDQPEHPLERAIFWVEYVIRHKGAFHLRSAADELNFFQYFLLDVIAFLTLAGMSIVLVLVYGIKFVLKKICGGKCKTDKLQEKKTN